MGYHSTRVMSVQQRVRRLKNCIIQLKILYIVVKYTIKVIMQSTQIRAFCVVIDFSVPAQYIDRLIQAQHYYCVGAF
jgi:hypothetical protein